MALPELTDEQRKAALEKAMASRKKKAEVKQDLKAARLTISDVLLSDNDVIRSMKVFDVIKSLPGYGKARATKWMQDNDIPMNRRIRGLGKHQVDFIIESFGA